MRVRFPIKGVHKGLATVSQPELTTPDALNMRAYDTKQGRIRGGQRPVLDKWGSGDQVGNAEQPVVAMAVVATLR